MTRFITLSSFGLLLSELAIFFLAFIRRLSDSPVGSSKDLLGAAAIFGFFIFSLLMVFSFVFILISIFKKRPIKPQIIWLAIAVILWIPANIALLNI